uniref:Uncharacterized protein n=1 Tax=Pseudo-nitzschia australis TaxID=44445 RepID=A0A7S4EPY3_9STRA|mmetsp:Transcript_3369/g.7354  ORF Transcript_3369/g.7354 Transcript_3369/m.7354 type:complete len:104 (-) Transcript_3369:564-875(-)
MHHSDTHDVQCNAMEMECQEHGTDCERSNRTNQPANKQTKNDAFGLDRAEQHATTHHSSDRIEEMHTHTHTYLCIYIYHRSIDRMRFHNAVQCNAIASWWTDC